MLGNATAAKLVRTVADVLGCDGLQPVSCCYGELACD